MADNYLSSHSAILDKQSFFNNIRTVGGSATPFIDEISEGGKPKGSPKKGHKWGYRPRPVAGAENAYAEGSKRADITSWGEVELINHLQIFKKTSGITGSEAEAYSEAGRKRKLEDDKLLNREQMGLDIELAVISDTPPVAATTLSDVRKMGGVKSYIPASAIIDAADAPIDKKDHIDAAMKIMHKNGIRGRVVIQAGEDAFLDLQYILADKKLLSNSTTEASDVLTHVTNAWYKKVKLVSNPNFAANEILIFAPALIKWVLLRSIQDKDCTHPDYDVDVEEDIIEATVRVEDPYALFWVKNVGRSA